MQEKLRFLGLDVHAETIAVAVAEPDGEVRSLGTIPNRAESIRKMIRKLGPAEKLRACYEAGPTGYVVYWQLAEMGVQCEVVAPTLVPVKAGDRVKTDRRDAEKLARCYRSGDLTAVWVPDEGSEALRDLVRAREAAKQDQMRARHRLSKFLLRSGQRPPSGVRPWTRPWLIWVAQLRFTQVAQESTRQDYLHEVEHMRERVSRLEQAIMEAVKLASPALQQVINDLQALRGIADISAVTIAAELRHSTWTVNHPQRTCPLQKRRLKLPGDWFSPADGCSEFRRQSPLALVYRTHFLHYWFISYAALAPDSRVVLPFARVRRKARGNPRRIGNSSPQAESDRSGVGLASNRQFAHRGRERY
jgi:transposase